MDNKMGTKSSRIIDESGERWETKSGVLHREGDEPAVITKEGERQWWYKRKLHREGDKPAVVRPDGFKEWWKHGLRYREGGAHTVELADGTMIWKITGRSGATLIHRDGEPAIIRPNGDREWWTYNERIKVIKGDGTIMLYHNSRLHCSKGPAIIYPDGTEKWYLYGKFHRGGGEPAISHPDGRKEWYHHGKQVGIEEDVRTSIEHEQCKICMDNKRCVLFNPCGHIVACNSCSRNLSACPLCRKVVTKRINAFI
jgi:hypothetical protein